MQKSIIVGLTGNFGTGKTTVARIFKELGAKVINADRLVHRYLASCISLKKDIRRIFGRGVCDAQGRIRRKQLASIVFNEPEKLRALQRLLHPLVIKEITCKIKQERRRGLRGLVVVEAPLLFEAGLVSLVDRIVVVRSSLPLQLERLSRYRGLRPQEVRERLRRQLPMRDKLRQADFVVDNRGSIGNTRRQVEGIWKKLVICGKSE